MSQTNDWTSVQLKLSLNQGQKLKLAELQKQPSTGGRYAEDEKKQKIKTLLQQFAAENIKTEAIKQKKTAKYNKRFAK